MINRSQNRRRRGGNRGGNRPNTPNKGNAAQLLEKYKGLARDAQMSGDRVQQEYYLQFADHYFRVLEEFNARKDDQQPQRGGSSKGRQQDDDDGDDQSNDQPQAEKPKRQRRKRDDEQAKDQGEDKPRKQASRQRKPKREENDGGEMIADALPPAIGSNEEDEAA